MKNKLAAIEGILFSMGTSVTRRQLMEALEIDDGQFDDNSVYMAIGTLESYLPIRAHFGAKTMIPVYLEVEDGLRLERAIARERTQKTAKYEEMCRRFLADQADFSEEKLTAANITRRFKNEDKELCLKEVLSYIEHEL